VHDPERLDLLTADGLVSEIILAGLLARQPTEDREAILGQVQEAIDALSAHPDTTPRGRQTFVAAQEALDRISQIVRTT
jgi:hypothetical protein